jgi:CDP-diglyceride synthetase
MIPPFLKRQLLANDIYLVVASGCFAFVAMLLTYLIYPMMIFLIQYNFDKGISSLTVNMWMENLPSWVEPAYNLVGTLLLILIIWAIVCAVQRAVALVYLYWQSEQAEKYPLEY